MNRTHWIFGYGSILWKTGFQYVEQHPVYLHGYVRRFWQASADHRGTPEYPGRVVTLVPEPGENCWGMAYGVEDHHWEQVLSILDHREKGGYVRREVKVTHKELGMISATTYIADEKNEHYLGEASLSELTHQILTAHGPSGSNKEYILKLDTALTQHGMHDQHVSQLAEQVRLRHTQME